MEMVLRCDSVGGTETNASLSASSSDLEQGCDNHCISDGVFTNRQVHRVRSPTGGLAPLAIRVIA